MHAVRLASMNDAELFRRVRELRALGASPRDIARSLGVRPAVVAPLVREIAREEMEGEDGPRVVGCWISPGWSEGLTVEGHPEWPRGADDEVGGASGAVSVMLARRHRHHRVSVCGYLVDAWCLGVKDALGPRVIDVGELRGTLDHFFGAYGAAPVEAPIELAQELVLGAVDYARELGFEPHPDFAPARDHLGSWSGSGAIRFGREGKPYFIQGPNDRAERIMATLRDAVGEDGFHFIVQLDFDEMADAA